MKIRVGAWAMVAVVGAVSACSSGETSGSSPGSTAGTSSTAGTFSSAGGTTSNGGTSAVGGAPTGSSGTGFGTAGASSAGATSGGMSGNAGGAPGGSAGNASGGSAGPSTGGTTGTGGGSSGGSAGLGGTINDLGTIVGSPAVAKLLALTKDCTAANKVPSDTGKFATDAGKTVHVCALPGAAGTANAGGALFWNADMDIDCDGLTTTNCPGAKGSPDHDPSYYNQTAFSGPNSSALTSEKDPYVVIPGEIKEIDQQNGGNIVAVIYGNQIEFAVFGDTIEYQAGDDNEPIGEASVRTAKGLGIPASPASGGVGSGVTYIAFAGKGSQPKDMEDLAEVQALGTKLLESLLQNNP